MIKKGTFTSVWDDGDTEISTFCTLNTETGELIAESIEDDSVDNLDREYFTDEEGNDYDVCPECHEYILKTVINEGVGKQLFEEIVCSNSDCVFN